MSHSSTAADAKQRTYSIVLIGNPNTGKTTLFNALTGLRHRVGNYPGVTVETKTGAAVFDGRAVSITDVPGTYSLSPRSPDEMLAVDLLLGHRPEHSKPDCIVCILDASNLERNLYLATQVLELGSPVVLALNMTDVAAARGLKIDVEKLAETIGAPMAPIQANAGKELDALRRAVLTACEGKAARGVVEYPESFQREAAGLRQWLAERQGGDVEDFLIRRCMLDAGGSTELQLAKRFGGPFLEELAQARQRLAEAGCAVPAIEARTRYRWIGGCVSGAVTKPAQRPVSWTDRIDRVLIHPVFGMAVFLILMAIVFQSIFSWAALLMDPIVAGFDALSALVESSTPEGPLRELLAQGIVAGVGNVVVFLPQIVILFGFIAVLEDCGYMARAAFLMDRVMSRSGLSGKSFIPMLTSFACAIPGVMATRTIEDRRDRLATILVAPLMSCSARLPVYVLLIGAFIPARKLLGFVSLQGLVLLSMYLIGLVLAPLVAWLLKATLLRGQPPVFLLELPSYKLPSAKAIVERMIDRGWAFLKRAGTLILAATVVLWALQYYPRPASIAEPFAGEQAEITRLAMDPKADVEAIQGRQNELDHRLAAAYQAQSYLGRMGKAIEPVVEPLGWDWRIGMAAIASFPAREVVVSALGTIFSVGGDEDEQSVSLRDALQGAVWPDGRKLFTIPTALSLMVFFALCCQCAATLSVIARETNSWRWPAFTFVYMTGLAYVAALLTYQIGSRL